MYSLKNERSEKEDYIVVIPFKMCHYDVLFGSEMLANATPAASSDI